MMQQYWKNKKIEKINKNPVNLIQRIFVGKKKVARFQEFFFF
jgi:hypothetical protein